MTGSSSCNRSIFGRYLKVVVDVVVFIQLPPGPQYSKYFLSSIDFITAVFGLTKTPPKVVYIFPLVEANIPLPVSKVILFLRQETTIL